MKYAYNNNVKTQVTSYVVQTKQYWTILFNIVKVYTTFLLLKNSKQCFENEEQYLKINE